jgi:hypothetical protein
LRQDGSIPVKYGILLDTSSSDGVVSGERILNHGSDGISYTNKETLMPKFVAAAYTPTYKYINSGSDNFSDFSLVEEHARNQGCDYSQALEELSYHGVNIIPGKNEVVEIDTNLEGLVQALTKVLLL